MPAMPSPAVIAMAIVAVIGLGAVVVLFINLAEPSVSLSDDSEVRVVIEQPTLAPTPTPTRTPKPPTLPADAPALRMAWLPQEMHCGGGGAPHVMTAEPLVNDGNGRGWLGGLVGNPGYECVKGYIDHAETAALGAGGVHFPHCPSSQSGHGRFVLLSPSPNPDDAPYGYPEPTSLVVDGIDQFNAWIHQDGTLSYPNPADGDFIEYEPYVTAYLQVCAVWDGDRAAVSPHPLPTPMPTPTPTPTPEPAGGSGGQQPDGSGGGS